MYAAALATCALLLGIATHGVLATDCIGDPSQPSCAGYVYREAGQDVDSLCGMMPGMVGCELKEACGSDTRGFCHPFSLLADICRSDKGDMGGMMGCHNYVALCSKNSTVAECTRPGPVPRFVTSSAARNAAVMMCASMPAMQGCTGSPPPPHLRCMLNASRRVARPRALGPSLLALTLLAPQANRARTPPAAARHR